LRIPDDVVTARDSIGTIPSLDEQRGTAAKVSDRYVVGRAFDALESHLDFMSWLGLCGLDPHAASSQWRHLFQPAPARYVEARSVGTVFGSCPDRSFSFLYDALVNITANVGPTSTGLRVAGKCCCTACGDATPRASPTRGTRPTCDAYEHRWDVHTFLVALPNLVQHPAASR
jgi:hypothetical protein